MTVRVYTSHDRQGIHQGGPKLGIPHGGPKLGIPQGVTSLPCTSQGVASLPCTSQGVPYPWVYLRVCHTHGCTSGCATLPCTSGCATLPCTSGYTSVFGRVSPGYTSVFGRFSPGYTSLSARFDKKFSPFLPVLTRSDDVFWPVSTVFYHTLLLARVPEVHLIINPGITTVLHLLARMCLTLGDYIGFEDSSERE